MYIHLVICLALPSIQTLARSAKYSPSRHASFRGCWLATVQQGDGTALDHYWRGGRLDWLASSIGAPGGARRSVKTSTLTGGEAKRTTRARVRLVVLAD